MKTIVVIPARLNSTRLPEKVLLDLHGKTVVERVYEQCMEADKIDEVYIATDDTRVYDSCRSFTRNVLMTKDTHQSGTDRIAEVVKELDGDIIINVQGDEPFIEPDLINRLAEAFEDDGLSMVSVMKRIKYTEDLKNPNIVKLTVDRQNYALYFSRSIIPYHRDAWSSLLDHHLMIPEPLKFYRHLGIYGYTKDFLLTYAGLEQTHLEKVEKLEQLRVLENGFRIKMIETDQDSIGIDTIEDYQKALEFYK